MQLLGYTGDASNLHSLSQVFTRLAQEGFDLSVSTVERVLKHAGFGKLKRRTNKELGKTLKGKIILERAQELNFSELEKFHVDPV